MVVALAVAAIVCGLTTVVYAVATGLFLISEREELHQVVVGAIVLISIVATLLITCGVVLLWNYHDV